MTKTITERLNTFNPSVDDMQWHVEQLSGAHNIIWQRSLKPSAQAWAIRLTDCERLDIPWEIANTATRHPVSCASALHDIRHYLERYQRSRRDVVRET
jgi:hypothetical protein